MQIYYETRDGDAGLAEITEDGSVVESGDTSFGTLAEQRYESFEAFLCGSLESLSEVDLREYDGWYHPDDYLRFKVVGGVVPKSDWPVSTL